MLEEIYAGLTKPLSAEDAKAGFLKRDPRPRLLPPDTPENLMEYFHEQDFHGWEPDHSSDRAEGCGNAEGHEPQAG